MAICLSILNNRLASPPVFWRLLWVENPTVDVADTQKLALKSSIVVKASWAIGLMAIVWALSCLPMYCLV